MNRSRAARIPPFRYSCRRSAISRRLRERLAASGLDVTVSAEGLHEEDWADNWKQYYHPVRVGEHIVIVPEWEMETFEPREGDVVVMMDPGMAFGTGTHETAPL